MKKLTISIWRDKLPGIWQKRLEQGWQIALTSCSCGGRYAWLKPIGNGSMQMMGCVCHLPDNEK